MIPRHPLSAPGIPLHECVLWLEEKLLDMAADLSNVIEEYEICSEGATRYVTEADRQWLQHLALALGALEERPVPEDVA